MLSLWLYYLFFFFFSGDDLYITFICRYNMAGSLLKRLSLFPFYVLCKKYFNLPVLFIVSQ
jgi:hypothetical protein